MKRERKHYKALYFDLCVMNLKKNFSDTNVGVNYDLMKLFTEDSLEAEKV